MSDEFEHPASRGDLTSIQNGRPERNSLHADGPALSTLVQATKVSWRPTTWGRTRGPVRILFRPIGVLVSVLVGLAVGLLLGCLAGTLNASLNDAWVALPGWVVYFTRAGAIAGGLAGVGASVCGADPWLD